MRNATIADFEERGLWPAEEELIAAIRAGRDAIIAPERPEARRDDNAVRTDLIEYLATGGCEALRPRATGVRLFGAWIEPPDGAEALDLRSETLPVDLALVICVIDAPVTLLGANAKTLNFGGARLAKAGPDGAALSADGLTTSGGVLLRAAGATRFEAEGAVRLLGAKIGGDLVCAGARLVAGPGAAAGAALNADGLETGGDVFLSAMGAARFEAEGAVRLLGATIGGDLDCDGAHLVAGPGAAEGAALHADGLETSGGVFLSAAGATRFEAEGEVRLLGATIGGDLACVGGRFRAAGSGDALSLQNARITGSLQVWDAPAASPAEPLFEGGVGLT